MDGYRQERSWVYDRHHPGRGGLKPTFVRGVDEFIKKAEKQRRKVKHEGGIRCPCDKCMCVPVLSASEIKVHLYNHGFQPNYWYWTDHGEKVPHIDPKNVPSSSGHNNNEDPLTLMQHMVEDALGSNFDFQSMGSEANGDEVSEDEGNDNEDEVNGEKGSVGNNNEEPPNKDAQDFYDLLTAANQPLYEGASESKLSVCVKLMACKTNWNVPQKCLDFFASMLIDVCPKKDSLPKIFYQAKKMVSMLGLKSQKIDCCVNGCMLYYKDTITDRECRFCKEPRYVPRKSGMGKYKDVPAKRMFYIPITPRLKRLYASIETAKQMRWHHLNIYWVDERAKKTYESFQEKVENLSQVGEASGSGTKEVDAATRLKLWAESAGGKTRGLLYGAGDMSKHYKPGVSSLTQTYSTQVATNFSAEIAAQMKAVEQRASDAEHRANAAEQRATVAQEESQRANKRTKNLERQVKKLAENISCIKGDQHRRHRDYEEDDSDSMDDSVDSLDD